ncbi:MAG: SusD/RagB family nutrient-binding outer membrane lipoprotein, partial [Bacteroidota bacterium]
MKKSIHIICLVMLVAGMTGCKKYLDINSDPASPNVPSLAALLSPAQAVMSRTLVFDGRATGAFTQFWSNTASQDVNDIHNANQGGSGAGNQGWRDVYQLQGPAIDLIIQQGTKNEQWDYVGVAFALRAWGFQHLTDMHSDIVFRQAWEPNRVYFDYDNQETVYKGIDSICRRALSFLNRTDGKVNQSQLARGDIMFQGNRDRWIRFVYGLMARNYHRLTNKADYKADSVIKYVDLSLAS